ncbi:medium-chain-fatty-acid-CoA ligase [Phenylobacterium zucineum HLK1]|uniref:Medium-chain-fatty-acid-CoA ligase n=1 Tax=Phenylobacterium zucineum (strain HLK1) TaxID=450851 RepID=B4RFK4_PHEZH|nr:AMP-binding protein [Phenylobacterium zucineum]ACG77085.1 medium-chain-fatty-acid-CoA ligase [Phenylobacterium zucineum HLK1]
MIDGAMQPFALTLDKFLEHAAKWRPTSEVVTAREGGKVDRIGYADLKARSQKVSAVLAGLGVGLGCRVATLAWNTQAHVEAWYGVMGMGAVCHTLNPRLTPNDLAAMVERSAARILIASADLLPLAREIAERVSAPPRLLVIDGEGEGDAAALEPMIAGAAEGLAWGGFDETAPCGLCFTSGTTGAPKGVTYTHRASYLHTLRSLQVDTMALAGGDAVLTVVPMFHANAWGLPFAAPAVGAKLVLPGRNADGASLARLIRAEDVTVAVGVPTVWLGLLEHLEAEGGEVPSLKRILVGGAPMPPALMARLEARLGVVVQTSWGMTELSPSGTVMSAADPGRTAAQAGRPAVGVDLMVADSEGRPLPEQRNVEGHLHVRGAAVIERYFGETKPAVDAEGWFATGDLARIDEAGNLYITGRAKDLIKSGGEWINPAEIEAVVSALPEVSLAAVIGRQDPKWGERPILLVELREPKASDAALLEPLKGKVASWWIPDEVVRLKSMPLAATGKIDKLKLRAEYGAGAAEAAT